MGTILYNCNHRDCMAKSVGFLMLSSYTFGEGHGAVLSKCPACLRPTLLTVKATSGQQVAEIFKSNEIEFRKRATILESFPQKPKRETVAALPPKIAAVFEEAEANFSDGRNMSASIMYRKAVELTVKERNPDGKGMLNERIRQLQKKEAVPETLIDLLDTVKFLGNEGAHDEDPPSSDDVERGRDFTRLFLVYSYELPARVDAALAKDGS